jgi:hypothetical protein
MAIAAPVDAASVLQEVVELEDQAEALAEEMAGAVPQRLIVLQQQITAIREALEDTLDAAESQASLAETPKDERLPWEKLKANLGL